MEYVNPTSIAQMAQVPKDTSLPGTGYGLMQGWKEGEAMAKAKDFLSLSQAAQAQDYVKQQFEMQSKWQDRPMELQKQQAALEGTQLGNQKTKWELSQAHDAAKKAKVMDQLHLVAAFNPLLENAKTEIEKQAVFNQLVNQAQRLGVTVDPDLTYNPNIPNSWDNVLRNSRGAAEVSAYDRKHAQEMRQQATEFNFRGNQGDKDRSSREAMNKMDNEVRLLMHREEQGLKKHLATQGAEGFAATKGWYMREWDRIEAIPPAQRTAQDKARALVAERVLSGQTYNMAPERVGARAGATIESELNALRGSGSKGDRPSTDTTVSPNGITIQPLPESKEIPSQSIEDRVNQYLK